MLLIDYTCPLFQVKQTVEEEHHALADYVKDSHEQTLLQVKYWNLLSVQETKLGYRNKVMKTKAEC